MKNNNSKVWQHLIETASKNADTSVEEISAATGLQEEEIYVSLKAVREFCSENALPGLVYVIRPSDKDGKSAVPEAYKNSIAQEIFFVNDMDWKAIDNPFE